MRASFILLAVLLAAAATAEAGIVNPNDIGRIEVVSMPTSRWDPRDRAGKRHVHDLGPTIKHKQGGSSGNRKLLTPDGLSFQPYYSSVGSACPPADYTGDFAAITSAAGLGEMVWDGRICRNALTGKTVIGGAAQDFITKPSLETYGWAFFKTPARPSDSEPTAVVNVQGLQLQVVGALARGTAGTCTLTGVSVAIMGSTASREPNKADIIYNQVISLPGKGDEGMPASTWTWTSNATAVISLDLVDILPAISDPPPPQIGPTNIELKFDTGYWIRIKLIAPYVGTGTARCFAFWATSSTAATSDRPCRWQEVGGYSTTCTGAAAAAGNTMNLPGPGQTLYSCFNGGAPGSKTIKRCAFYSAQTVPPIPCPATFNDFNFALYGMQGMGGGGNGDGGGGGDGPACYSQEVLVGCDSNDPACTFGSDLTGVPPLQAGLDFPRGVQADSKGNIWFVDYTRRRVYVLNATTNSLILIAGSGSSTLDGNAATSTYLANPWDIAVDEKRQAVYISDADRHRVRKVDLQTGIMTSVAGRPDESGGYNGDGIQGTSAQLNAPIGLGLLGDTLFIADYFNNRVRKLDLTTGIITTYAGNGGFGTDGDGGLAVDANVNNPIEVYPDPAGGLWISQNVEPALRKVNGAGYINSVAQARINIAFGVAADSTGRFFIGQDGDMGMVRLDPTTGDVTPVLVSSGPVQDFVNFVTTSGRNIIVSTWVWAGSNVRYGIKKLVPSDGCPQ